MAQKYLLSCSCGREIPVEVSQAGETVTCACGAAVEVPSMREIRALPPDDSEPPDPVVKRRSWHPVQGILFGFGALLMVVCGGFALLVHVARSNINRDEPAQLREQLASHVAELEKADIEQIYEGWKINKALPLRKERPFSFVVLREWYSALGWEMMLYLGGALIGAVLVVASLTIRPRASEPPPPPA